MGSFTRATAGTPQNATPLAGLANGMNGSTTAGLILNGGGGIAVSVASVTAGNAAVSWLISGDTNPRGRLRLNSSGLSFDALNPSNGSVLANFYNPSNTSLKTDQALTTNSDVTASNSITTGALSATSATLSGATTVSTTVHGIAINAASNFAIMASNNIGGAHFSYDDSVHSSIHPSTNASTRNLTLVAQASGGGNQTGGYFGSDGELHQTGSGQVYIASGSGGVSRLTRTKTGRIGYNSGGTAASSYQTTGAMSHGLGAMPDAAVITFGDDGSITDTRFGGLDQVGSSTFVAWCTVSSSTDYSYGQVLCYKSAG